MNKCYDILGRNSNSDIGEFIYHMNYLNLLHRKHSVIHCFLYTIYTRVQVRFLGVNFELLRLVPTYKRDLGRGLKILVGASGRIKVLTRK